MPNSTSDDETIEHESRLVDAINPAGNVPKTTIFRFTIVKPRQA